MITNLEKQQLAQFYFEDCFKGDWYSLCGINDFYNKVLQMEFYKDHQDEKLLGYKELQAFHCFHPIEESTKIKLITLTTNCFEQMGYKVNTQNIKFN